MREVGILPFHRLSDAELRVVIDQAAAVVARLEPTSPEAGGEFRMVLEVARSVLEERLKQRHPVPVYRQGWQSTAAEREGWDIAALEADLCRTAARPDAVKDFWTACIYRLEDLQAEHGRRMHAGREGRWPEQAPRFVIETYPPDDEDFRTFVRKVAVGIGGAVAWPDPGWVRLGERVRPVYPMAGYSVTLTVARPDRGRPQEVRLSVWRDREHEVTSSYNDRRRPSW